MSRGETAARRLSLCLVLLIAVALALCATPALAKKKHKKRVQPIHLGPVVTATAQSPSVSTGEASAAASCPGGLQAVGGGFSSPVGPGNAIVVHDSYLSSPTSWTVTGHSVGGSGAVTAEVYCRNTSRAPVTDVAATVPVSGVSGAVGTAAPTCPGSSRLIGGGFQSTTGINSGDFLTIKTNMATSASTWTVDGLNLESSTSFTLTGHAYCMSGINPPTILSGSQSVAAVQYTTVDASTGACPVHATPKKPKKGKKRKKRRAAPAQLLSAGGFSTPPATGATPRPIVGSSRIGTGGGWSGSAINATNGTGTMTLSIQGICV